MDGACRKHPVFPRDNIEHQSSVDYLMPFRLLTYMVQFWRYLTEKAGKKKARLKEYTLPPVLPIVFYQGERRWTAPTRFTEKVENARDFAGLIPEFEYLLISLRDKTSEEILAMKDGLAALIYLANPAKTEEFDEAVGGGPPFSEESLPSGGRADDRPHTGIPEDTGEDGRLRSGRSD